MAQIGIGFFITLEQRRSIEEVLDVYPQEFLLRYLMYLLETINYPIYVQLINRQIQRLQTLILNEVELIEVAQIAMNIQPGIFVQYPRYLQDYMAAQDHNRISIRLLEVLRFTAPKLLEIAMLYNALRQNTHIEGMGPLDPTVSNRAHLNAIRQAALRRQEQQYPMERRSVLSEHEQKRLSDMRIMDRPSGRLLNAMERGLIPGHDNRDRLNMEIREARELAALEAQEEQEAQELDMTHRPSNRFLDLVGLGLVPGYESVSETMETARRAATRRQRANELRQASKRMNPDSSLGAKNSPKTKKTCLKRHMKWKSSTKRCNKKNLK